MPLPAAGLAFVPSADIEDLLGDFLARKADIREVSLRGVHDKPALLRRLRQTLGFPAGIGHNWDSLADALTDLPWRQTPNAAGLLLFRHCRSLQQTAAEDFRTFIEILEDSLDFWRSQGLDLHIVLEGSRTVATR